jgi:hypothetical protein
MDSKSKVFTRFVLFGVIAGSLIWLGTHKPRVAATGPGLVVVQQGSNVSFQPQNAQTPTFVASSPGTVTNVAIGATNGTSK